MAPPKQPIDVEPEPEENPETVADAGDDSAPDYEEPVPEPPYPPVVAAILAAALFLTRLPIPLGAPLTPSLFGRAMGWFPLIGAGLGIVGGLVFGLLCGLGVPSLVAAVLVVALLVVVTGALHEDGLADTADGYGGGHDRDGKLAIMRDSRIGSYGVLALVLAVAVKVAAIAALPSTWMAIKVLAVAGAMSRAAVAAQSHWQPPARTDGLSATLGGPAPGATVLALALALGIGLLLIGTKAVLVMIAMVLATWGLIRLAYHHVGGQTGDILGATQQVVEILVLVLLVGAR